MATKGAKTQEPRMACMATQTRPRARAQSPRPLDWAQGLGWTGPGTIGPGWQGPNRSNGPRHGTIGPDPGPGGPVENKAQDQWTGPSAPDH